MSVARCCRIVYRRRASTRYGTFRATRQHDFALLDVTADILAGGKNSRLYKRLVYTDRTATAVTAFVGPFEIGSQVQLIVTVKPGVDPAVVEKALDEEVARFLADGPDPGRARSHPHD